MTSRDPIVRKTLDDGTTRYWVRLDVGLDPATGRRRQRRASFRTLRQAKTWVAETRVSAERGTYLDRHRVSLSEHLDGWLAGRLNIRPSTRLSYGNVLRPFHEQLGAVEVGALTRAQVESVRDGLLDGSLRKVGAPGRPLSARSVRYALQTLEAALQSAVRDGLVSRNVVEHVERPCGASAPGAAWNADQARAFLAVAATDRLHAGWLLAFHGLRRGEVLGLRWEDIDLEQRTISITRARVAVGGDVVVSGTKTARGTRILPLPVDVVDALDALRAQSIQERTALGPAYDPTGYVIVDEAGAPLRPEAFSDAFRKLALHAGCPLVRLHDLRHTSVSLKRSLGWPDHLVAAWHGHDESVMRRTYTHHYLADLRAHADALTGGL